MRLLVLTLVFGVGTFNDGGGFITLAYADECKNHSALTQALADIDELQQQVSVMSAALSKSQAQCAGTEGADVQQKAAGTRPGASPSSATNGTDRADHRFDGHSFTFVGGPHHSGTTLIALLLASHVNASGLVTNKHEDEGQWVQSVYMTAHSLSRTPVGCKPPPHPPPACQPHMHLVNATA